MTEQDRPWFVQALTALVEVFPGEFTERGHALYFESLRDLSREALQVGLRRAVAECRFLPKPVELRELAIGAAEPQEDRAERAWLAWRYAARVVGSYRSISVVDRALADTLCAMFGGWPEACAAEFSDEMWSSKRKEFSRVYRVMLSRADDGSPVRLAGHHERTNTLTGAPAVGRLPESRTPVLSLAGAVEWQPTEPALVEDNQRPHGQVRSFPRLVAERTAAQAE